MTQPSEEAKVSEEEKSFIEAVVTAHALSTLDGFECEDEAKTLLVRQCAAVIRAKVQQLATQRKAAREALMTVELDGASAVRIAIEALGGVVVDDEDLS